MKIKIALAALACSGTLLALLPTSASAAPLSRLTQNHGVATADNPLIQKVHRWWRRGWAASCYGYGYGSGYGYGYPNYRPYYRLTDHTITAATTLHPPPPPLLLLPAVLGPVLLGVTAAVSAISLNE